MANKALSVFIALCFVCITRSDKCEYPSSSDSSRTFDRLAADQETELIPKVCFNEDQCGDDVCARDPDILTEDTGCIWCSAKRASQCTEDPSDEVEDMDVDMNANQKTKTKRNAKKLSKKQVKAMEDEKVLEQRKKNFFGANAANSAKKHKKYKRGTRSYIDGNGMFVTEDYKETDDEDEDEDVAVNDQVEQKESNGAKHVQNKENNDKNNHENTSNKKLEKSSKAKKTANNSKKGKNGKNSNGKNGNIMNFFKVK